jgi:cytochrome P450
VVGFASLLLAAGSETTTNLIGNALLALHDHPEQAERLRAEPALVPQLLEEALRFDAPVQLLMRLAMADTELAGVGIPEGSLVVVLLGAANRDPERFPDAEAFDLGRNAQGHLAFGLGNHFCLGASLARLEARIAVELLLERLPDWRIDAERVERHGSFLIRGPRELPLRFGPRGASPSG